MAAITLDSFWQFDTNYWFKKLNSSPNGLSQTTANEILLQAGVARKGKSHFQKDILLFFSQFKSPLMWLLIGA